MFVWWLNFFSVFFILLFARHIVSVFYLHLWWTLRWISLFYFLSFVWNFFLLCFVFFSGYIYNIDKNCNLCNIYFIKHECWSLFHYSRVISIVILINYTTKIMIHTKNKRRRKFNQVVYIEHTKNQNAHSRTSVDQWVEVRLFIRILGKSWNPSQPLVLVEQEKESFEVLGGGEACEWLLGVSMITPFHA